MLGDIFPWIQKHSSTLYFIRYVVLLQLFIMMLVYMHNPHIKAFDWAQTGLLIVISAEVGILTGKYIVEGFTYVYNYYH